MSEVVLKPNNSGSTNELFNKYDQMSYAAVVNMYSLSKDNPSFVLSGFDPNDDNHLFFLHTALVVKDILNKQLEVKCSFWKWIITNWKLRKIKVRVKWKHGGTDKNIHMNELIEFMQPLVKEFGLPDDFEFGDIYRAFYKEGCV